MSAMTHRPCETCGSAILWWRKGEFQCANCHPEPFNPFADKVVIVEVEVRGRMSTSLESFESAVAGVRQSGERWLRRQEKEESDDEWVN